ncbi:MAG: AMP-binding protein [Rhodospirillales bacterium]|nr:MAG: AMP-binding protein [Rhodospirillales bacterium]
MSDLAGWIGRHAEATPDKTALRFEGAEINYAGLAARIDAAARALTREFGIARGDRIAHLGLNHPDMLVLLFACARLGAILLPLNWRLAPPEHRFILADSRPKLLVAAADFAAEVAAIGPEANAVPTLGLGADISGWPSFEALVRAAGGAGSGGGSGDDPVLLVYTSGTTGRPKGALLTQANLHWNAANSIDMHALGADDHVLTTIPMFHVGGLNIQTLPALQVGATVTLHQRFVPGATLAAIAGDRPSLTVLVPAQMTALFDDPGWATADLSSLRLVTTGSTTVPVPLIRRLHERGVPVIQVYGATETAPVVVYQTREDAERRIGSAGRAGRYSEMRLVDAAGAEVSRGQPGEILIRGPQVMREYWGDPDGTAAVLRDGWFHTGDIGHTDAEGWLYVDDRKKDLIISGSENIYPAELETVLAECDAIAESAVVARHDERWGEVPVAAVVLRDAGAMDRTAVLTLFEGRIARFKHPRDVVFLPALPRNAMGKVQKFRLREMVAESGGG